jgi:hypothetical protein
MELALRGLGSTFDPAACYASSSCRTTSDLACYSVAALSDDCATWRAYTPAAVSTAAGLPAPTTIQPPAIDTDPNSPTYGQAIINGVAVGTPAQAQALVAAQIAANAAANAAQVQATMNTQAAAQCTVQASDCGMFTSISADCSTCNFDPSSPAFLIVAAAFLIGMMAWSRK